MEKRKGVSPVIATVLLIALVVVIAIIIFLWFKGMTQEAITKFDTNVELVCNDVAFDASYSGGIIYITNTGNVPIYDMQIKIFKNRGYTIKDISEISGSGWPELGLRQGNAYDKDISSELTDAEKIILTPILLGNSERGKRAHTCVEEFHGFEIDLT